MQRYRVNYGLLIGLAIGLTVIAGGVYGVYVVQASRNADTLLSQAEEAEEGGDLRGTLSYLLQYRRLREEDAEAFLWFARVAADIADAPDSEPSERSLGYQALESYVTAHPENREMQRRLIDLLVRSGRADVAVKHVDYLLNEDPQNEELQEMRFKGLLGGPKNRVAIEYGYKLVGYDRSEGEFDPEKSSTPEVHRALAFAVRVGEGDPELADRIIDHLVATNPDLSDAYLARGRYYAGTQRVEEAAAEMERALELDPDNVEALLASAQIIASEAGDTEDEREAAYDKAYDLLQKAAGLASTDQRVYLYLANLEKQRGEKDAAIAHFDEGIRASQAEGMVRGEMVLRLEKTRMLLDFGRIDAAEESVEQLVDLKLNQAYVDYLNARIAFFKGQWFKASEVFFRLRPVLTDDPRVGLELSINLALCYERLEQYERAREAYQIASTKAPTNPFVTAGVERMNAKLGQQQGVTERSLLNEMIKEQLDKAEGEQDWGPVMAAIDQYADQPNLPPGSGEMIKAEVFVRRKKYREARKVIATIMQENPDDIRVWRAGIRVLANDPERGPEAALEKLEMLVDKFGDTALLRLDKADFLIVKGGDNVAERVLAIPEGTESWDTEQQLQLWKGLSERFAKLRDGKSRRVCLAKIADLSPDELPTLLDLFRAAIQDSDAAAIAKTQQDILKLVGTKENATYLYTEGTKVLWEVAQGADKSELDRADQLIERALAKRGEWHELFLLQAKVHLARGDKEAGLTALDEALRRGPANGRAILLQVSLLLERQRYGDAKRVLDKLAEPVRQQLLGRNYAVILLNTGDVAKALESAKTFAESERASKDSGSQLWYGKFLLRALASSKLDNAKKEALSKEADTALAAAVELNPASGEAWLTRIGFLVDFRRRDEAEQTLRRAQLALTEDQLPMIVARSYEWLGRWFDAETAYTRLREQRPDDRNVTRLMATFYLGPRYQRNDKQAKATPLVNDLLLAGSDNPDLTYDNHVMWARRTAAELLAAKRDYQQLLRAQKLLSQNAVDGALSEEDKLRMARILASRPEPESRRAAIKRFADVQRNRILSAQDDLQLGALYYATGRWDDCRSQMRETIARNPGIPAVREAYIKMLLERGGKNDIKEASGQVARLQQVAPKSAATLQLVVRVAVRMGDESTRQVRQALAKLVPRDLSTADPKTLVGVAALLKEVGDFDRSEKIFRYLASKQPAAKLLLADFFGSRGEIEKSLDLLDEALQDVDLARVIDTGLAVVRANRSSVGDQYDSRVEAWLERALREDPESVPHLLQQASLREMQRRHDEAASVYRDLLGLPELTGNRRAVVLNNLGYLLAISSESTDVASEAMGYIQEAVRILGPQSDILDTRAVVHTTLKQYGKATSDLELAITDNPTASKYFHKARAHMLAGEKQAAVEAWNKAVELGISRDTVAVGEQEQFDRLERQLSETAAS